MNEDRIYFNGIDAVTGNYFQEPLSDQVLAELLHTEQRRWRLAAEERELQWWNDRYSIRDPTRKPARDVDPKKLSSSGWAVIFPQEPPPGVREELAPFLEHRRSQATEEHENYYRELKYIPGETKKMFLDRLGVEPGPAHPDQLPYYIMIVGDPTAIPQQFQYLLDMQYAVGRLHFGTPADYGRYAHSVIEVERGQSHVRPELDFFTVCHENDEATRRSAEKLIEPLCRELSRSRSNWQLRHGEQGCKAELARLLGGGETPAFLFTSAHGLAFPSGHPLQAKHQGAILCQEWLGPKIPAKREHYFAADDVPDGATLQGLIAFHFGCFSAGTPEFDNYPSLKPMRSRRRLAPSPFLAPLAQRLLSHPNGGALAVLGHVDRAWSRSFGSGKGKGLYHIQSFFKDLLDGHPVGSATDWLNERFAELSTELTETLNQWKDPAGPRDEGMKMDQIQMARLWRANNDARNFVVLGDPAVRLATEFQNMEVKAETKSFPGEAVAEVRATIHTPGKGEPTMSRELRDRLHRRKPVILSISPAELIRAERVRSETAPVSQLVIDASALIELLLRTPRAEPLEQRLFSERFNLNAPYFIELEVAQALHRYYESADLSAKRMQQALSDFKTFSITRHSCESLLPRILEIQKRGSIYDAIYIALAESLPAPLLSCDASLGSITGHQAQVELF